MNNYRDRGGCYQLQRITPSEISIILHIIRKPNSIIVLLFIQKISQVKKKVKTCLPPSMLSSSSIVHVQGFSAPQIFSKQQMSPFELSPCCSFHVFSYYFAQFLLLKRVKWVYLGVKTCELFLCYATSSPGLFHFLREKPWGRGCMLCTFCFSRFYWVYFLVFFVLRHP